MEPQNFETLRHVRKQFDRIIMDACINPGPQHFSGTTPSCQQLRLFDGQGHTFLGPCRWDRLGTGHVEALGYPGNWSEPGNWIFRKNTSQHVHLYTHHTCSWAWCFALYQLRWSTQSSMRHFFNIYSVESLSFSCVLKNTHGKIHRHLYGQN